MFGGATRPQDHSTTQMASGRRLIALAIVKRPLVEMGGCMLRKRKEPKAKKTVAEALLRDTPGTAAESLRCLRS